MGQPKAKWQFDPGAGWSADCGPFHLHANNAGDGRAELYDSEWRGLWERQLAEPYDIVDLMLLAEAELERRLRGAAETMDGKELVAEQEAVPAPCVSCSRLGSPNPGGWCGECGRMPVAVDLCDFELCAEQATHARSGMAYCSTHANEHDENVAQATRFGMDPGMASVTGIQFNYFCGQCDGRTVSAFEPIESCSKCGEPVPAGILEQAKRDNPMMVSEPCRVRCGGKPGCHGCNGFGHTTRRATAGEEWGYERAKPAFEAARKMLNAPAPLHPVDTSDKTPLGTVERVNDDGTVLVRWSPDVTKRALFYWGS